MDLPLSQPGSVVSSCLRQEDLPKPIRDIAWKGQSGCALAIVSSRRTRKPVNVVTTAIARELAGFVWAIARHVTMTVG